MNERREQKPGVSCFLLAAGRGTRLAPLTSRLPKACAPILNRMAALRVLDRLLQQRRLAGEVARLRRELEGRHQFGNLLGQNPKMQEVYNLVEAISDTDANVLIQGETGTGKELVARAIHYNSSRSSKPFVKVDCAALTETLLESELFGHVRGAFTGATRDRDGRFRTADGGTIFLDEIANVPKSLQVKLLRALQDSEFEPVGGDQTIKVNVRVIAASNEDLGKLAQEGRFRPDLYYRINVVRVSLPPLRERRDDIPLLALHFMEKYREKNRRQVKSITPAAMTRLLAYEWPGNVRELENAMERAVILAKGEAVSVADLPPFHEPAPVAEAAGGGGLLSDAVAEAEKRAILDALERCNGDKEQAAKELGISRASLYSKIKRYDIKAEG